MADRIQRLELDPNLLPWEPQFDETSKQFQAFAIYRDLGPERSLPKVAAHLKVSVGNVSAWSGPNRWVERAEAYDRYIDQRMREARETALTRMKQSETQLGRAMTSAALRRIIGYQDPEDPSKSVAALDLNKVTAAEAALLAREGVKISRISTGRPTELISGKMLITAAEYARDMEALIEIFWPYIPEHARGTVAEEIRAFSEGEHRKAIEA